MSFPTTAMIPSGIPAHSERQLHPAFFHEMVISHRRRQLRSASVTQLGKRPLRLEERWRSSLILPKREQEEGRCRQRSSSRKDRKSTRLNSSHVSISYAVFCLKKKNKAFDASHLADSN